MWSGDGEGKERLDGTDEREEEAVWQTHHKLIKWEFSALPACFWSCSAALSKTALFVQSIAP